MTIYDEYNIRYRLYNRPSGYQKAGINWLFLPGVPGADSNYLKTLADCLDIPGNIWFIDLPGSGSNTSKDFYPFDAWLKIYPNIVNRFDNPILVGHSFGAMLPFLFPEFEHSLKGFVILNSTPSFSIKESADYAKQFQYPDNSKEILAFISEPNFKTFTIALDACMPYYFPFIR